jgi:hypothetical protein
VTRKTRKREKNIKNIKKYMRNRMKMTKVIMKNTGVNVCVKEFFIRNKDQVFDVNFLQRDYNLKSTLPTTMYT